MGLPRAGRSGKSSKARRPEGSSAISISRTPTERLDRMTADRIYSLESDKASLKADRSRLEGEVGDLRDRLMTEVAEVARLKVLLSDANLLSTVALVLTGVGGFLVSYATFTGALAKTIADGSAGCLLAGIVLMIANSVLRRSAG